MSEPTPQTFRLAVAQAKTLRFTLDAAPESSVSGWAMAFYLRRKGALLLTKITGDGVTCTDGDAGVWEVAIAEEDTLFDAGNDPAAAVNGRAGLYDWAFWRTDDGSETPLAFGTCVLYRTAKTD